MMAVKLAGMKADLMVGMSVAQRAVNVVARKVQMLAASKVDGWVVRLVVRLVDLWVVEKASKTDY